MTMTPQDDTATPAKHGPAPSVAGKIFKASLAITLIIIVCKLMGGVEKFLLLFIYGKDSSERFQMDLYLALAVLVVLFYDIMRYSIIPSLLPALVKVRESLGPKREAALAVSFANLLALAVIPLLLAAEAFPGAFSWIFVRPGSDNYEREMATFLSVYRVMVPAGLFLVLGGVTYCLLQSRQRFAASALGDLAYKVFSLAPLVALIALVSAGGPERRAWAVSSGIRYVAIGVSVGALGLLLIQLVALWKDRASYRPVIDFRDEAFRGVWRAAAWPLLYAVLFIGARRVLDIYFGFSFNEQLGDRGCYTGLELSYRLVEVPFRFLVEPLAYALFPFLVSQRLAGDWKGFAATLGGGLRTALLILLPMSAMLFLLRAPVVSFLEPEQQQVADFIRLPLAFYSLAIVGFGMELLLTRAVFAAGDNRSPALFEVVALAVYLATILATRNSLQHGSVGLGFALSRTVKALIMAAVLARRTAGSGAGGGLGWVPFLIKAAVACAAGSALLWLVSRGLQPGGMLDGPLAGRIMKLLEPRHLSAKLLLRVRPVLELGLAGCCGLAAYAGLLWLLKVGEFRNLVSGAFRKIPGLRRPATT